MRFLLTTARLAYDPVKHDDDLEALRKVGYPVKENGRGGFEAGQFEKKINTMEELGKLLADMDCSVIINRPWLVKPLPEIKRYDYWVE